MFGYSLIKTKKLSLLYEALARLLADKVTSNKSQHI
jgi:hypothetical protein